MWDDAAFVVAAYLLGSLPTNRWIARASGADLSSEPDLHIALWRKVGAVQGLLAIVIDMLKGAGAVLGGRALGLPPGAVALGGLAAVSGQMWPVFSRFDGEKGNTTGLAMAAALDVVPLLLALVPAAVGAGVRTIPRLLDRSRRAGERLKLAGPPSRSMPLGMLVTLAVLPLAAWQMGRAPETSLAFLGLSLLLAVRRMTARLGRDLRAGVAGKALLNRLLYDRSRV